jgi:hypothetical protein
MPVFGTATMNLSSARRPATAPSAVQQQAASENVPPAADAAAPLEDRSEAEGRMRDSLLRRWEAEVLPVSQACKHGPFSVTPTGHHACIFAHPSEEKHFCTNGFQAREVLRRTGDWPSATTSPSDSGPARSPQDSGPQVPRRRNATDNEHMFLPPNPYPPGAYSCI